MVAKCLLINNGGQVLPELRQAGLFAKSFAET